MSEEGTEAAAATGVHMVFLCATEDVDFVANRPFVYGIFCGDEPVFIGQYCWTDI